MSNLCDLMLKHLDCRDGDVIADVGCGFGGTLAVLAQQLGPCQMKALNIDKRQLDMARATIEDALKDGQSCEYVHGDACDLPFADNSLDRLMALECVFHFASRKRFLRHAHRVLKPGAKLVLSDFALNPRKLLYIWPQILHGKHMRRVYGHNPIPWTQQLYRSVGRKLGFSEVHCEDISANTYPTREIMKHFTDKTEFTASFEKANKLMEYFKKHQVIQYIVVTMVK